MSDTAPPASGARFAGLDRLRGLALGAMLVHHLLSWTGGDEQVRRLLAVSDGMNATDLAAPAFAVALGASASLSVRRSAGRPGALRAALRRWAGIFAWGVAVSFALDGELDALGVLEILAVVGIVLTVAVASARGRPHPVRWAVAAAGLGALALPSIEAVHAREGLFASLVAGRFPILGYLALGAAGAAAADALGEREHRGRLLALAVGAVLTAVCLQAAGVAVWPPDRTPGGPQLVVPGAVATLLAWLLLTLVRGRLVDLLAHAGRQTLEVFVAHYAIRVVLNAGGWTGELHGTGWAFAAVGAAIALLGLAAAWDLRVTRRSGAPAPAVVAPPAEADVAPEPVTAGSARRSLPLG